jgi:hypothetical protein
MSAGPDARLTGTGPAGELVRPARGAPLTSMDGIAVTTPVEARLSWSGHGEDERVRVLYEQVRRAQWNARTDLDWSIEVDFGGPLPNDSAFGLAAFDASPLAPYGRGMWDRFRWEFHAWLASQFVYGEQGAVVAAARLAEVLPDVDGKCFAAAQAADEARHVEAFSRYVREKMPTSYPAAPALAALLEDVLHDARWDVTALGLQIMLEGLASATLRIGANTLHDPLVRRIMQLAARDETRHIAFGVLSLREVSAALPAAELAEREELVLEAAHLMRRWFLLDDVWERVGVDRAEGVAFAEANEMMVAYRRTVFAKAALSLRRIGLMTGRVRDGLDRLGLLEPGEGVGGPPTAGRA